MALYRNHEITENAGRLGLADEPGIYTTKDNFQGPREVVERYIDKEIALEAFRAAHRGLYPWQVEEYGANLDVRMDHALLAAYEKADRAFVAVDRPYRERAG